MRVSRSGGAVGRRRADCAAPERAGGEPGWRAGMDPGERLRLGAARISGDGASATQRPGFKFVPLRLDGSNLPVFAANRIFLDFSTYPDGPNGGELIPPITSWAPW